VLAKNQIQSEKTSINASAQSQTSGYTANVVGTRTFHCLLYIGFYFFLTEFQLRVTVYTSYSCTESISRLSVQINNTRARMTNRIWWRRDGWRWGTPYGWMTGRQQIEAAVRLVRPSIYICTPDIRQRLSGASGDSKHRRKTTRMSIY